uniref:Uncharacterized protein n=1 Tax=Anguilla anguilla TaxID=7936 RepID=A0A0E9XLH7_ANGAN
MDAFDGLVMDNYHFPSPGYFLP